MSLFLFLSLLFIISSSSSQQQQQHHHQTSFSIPATNTITLIDLLSNSTEHSQLLHLIQITRLVPIINALPTATLFAPTNKAIESSQSIARLTQDNLQLQLRQTLLYHLLNSSLPEPTDQSQQSPELLDSLLYPQPIDHDPEGGDTLLLGNQPQKLRIISRDQLRFIGVDGRGQGGIPLPTPDHFQNGTNVSLIPIQSILKPPPSLKELISTIPTLSTYASILPDRLLKQLDLLPHLTIFAPQNQAWDNLSSIELSYLKSNFSADDSIKLFRQATADNVLGSEGIGYSDRLQNHARSHPFPLVTIDGKTLSIGIDLNSNQLSINGSKFIEPDVLASNGVLHIVPNLLISSGDNPLQLTPEKYLLALNCTKFVSLFRQANLTATYLNQRSNDKKSYTILAVRDDVLSSIDRLNTNDTESLRKSLKYHVIEGKYLMDDLHDGMLLRTELKFKNPASNSKQRMPVSVSTSSGSSSSSTSSDSKKSTIVGFGGANVLGGDPIQIGNTAIYILSQIVEPPSDLLQVALSDIRFSTGVASIFSAKLDDQLRGVPELTYMMPTNKAFANLGLIMDYLLLERSKSDLVQVLKYHGVTEPIYLDELKLGVSQRYPTLEGGELYISKLASHNVTLHGPTVGGVPLNGETEDSRVINKRDVLIDNGSMQFVSQVELPPGVNIDLRKLLLGAKATTMLELIEASKMSWILMDEHQNQNKTQISDVNLARGYTILCPTDAAFTKINLTYYLEDQLRLQTLVQQHIIPVNPLPPPSSSSSDHDQFTQNPPGFKPLFLKDGMVYPTLLSIKEGGSSSFGDVFFRATPLVSNNHDDGDGDGDGDDGDGGPEGDRFSGRWIVGIKGARLSSDHRDIHYASKIINFGKITPKLISPSHHQQSLFSRRSFPSEELVRTMGGVLLLDQVLLPYSPSFWTRLRKPLWISFGLLLALGTLAWIGFVGWKTYRIRYRNKNDGTRDLGYRVVEPVEE